MRSYIALILAWLMASPAYGASVWPGNDGSLATFATRGLVIGQNWSTNDKDNYVTNSDAFVATTGVTASGTGATVARNTTAPLGEVSDFSINLGNTSAGYVEWAVRTLPSGLAGQQCTLVVQASTLSLGSATVVWQVVQSSNVVASVAMSASSVPVPVLLLVPCGTSANLAATTIRVAQTAYTSGSTLLKVAGVWYGDARKSGQFGDAANVTAWTAYTPTFGAGFGTTSAVSFFWRRVGDSLEARGTFTAGTVSAAASSVSIPTGLTIPTDAQSQIHGTATTAYLVTSGAFNSALLFVPSGATTAVSFTNVGDGLTTKNLSSMNVSQFISNGSVVSVRFTVPISNWPTASSAVTPSNQNVYGAARFSGTSAAPSSNGISYATFTSGSFASPTLYGQASATNASCGAANQMGICFATLPAGTYKISFQGDLFASFSVTATQCLFSLFDGTNRVGSAQALAGLSVTEDHISSLEGVVTYTTQQTNLAWQVQGFRAGGSGNCSAQVDNSGTNTRLPGLVLQRIDAANQQPVFVQSPVKAAATGTAPIAGEVGEIKTATNALISVNATTAVFTQIASVSLDPGVWELSGGITASFGTLAGLQRFAAIISTSNSGIDNSTAEAGNFIPMTLTTNSAVISTPIRRINVTSTGTYYLYAQMVFSGAVGTASYPASQSFLRAVRIGDR